MLHRASTYVVAVEVDYCCMISNFMEEGLEKAHGKSSGLSCVDVYANLEAGVGCKSGGSKKTQGKEQSMGKMNVG
jgi:hypothetical protein